jgi:YD repeat-containing protein
VTPTYDTNGNLTSDGTHTYSWDAEGRAVQMDTSMLTYDALGRMVEKGVRGAYTITPCS